MATQGKVRLVGRFPKGTVVDLKQAPNELALRAGGAEVKESKQVDDDHVLEFSGLDVGAVYFACGIIDGSPVEVRLRARPGREVDALLEQPPIQPDRVRLTDGSWLDEAPEKVDTPDGEVAPGPSQAQVGADVAQRSATPRGYGYPVDPSEQSPIRRQEDVDDDVPQMSDTETGAATEIVSSTQRQEEVFGVPQRSDTPHGQAYPIPQGDAVQVALERDSSLGKEARGEPVRVASEPLQGEVKAKGKAPDPTAAVRVSGAESERDNLSGHDAQGQPIYADVAANLGIEPAKAPLGDKSISDVKDAKPGEDPLAYLADPPHEAGESETETSSTGAGSKKPSDAPKAGTGKLSKKAVEKREDAKIEPSPAKGGKG